MTLPWDGSGRDKVRRDPEAVKICCSLVPLNCPAMACVMVVGGWMVKEYRNMFEVAAILKEFAPDLRSFSLRCTGCVLQFWG